MLSFCEFCVATFNLFNLCLLVKYIFSYPSLWSKKVSKTLSWDTNPRLKFEFQGKRIGQKLQIAASYELTGILNTSRYTKCFHKILCVKHFFFVEGRLDCWRVTFIFLARLISQFAPIFTIFSLRFKIVLRYGAK